MECSRDREAPRETMGQSESLQSCWPMVTHAELAVQACLSQDMGEAVLPRLSKAPGFVFTFGKIHVYLSGPLGEQGRIWGIELNVPLSLCVPSHTAFLTPTMDLTAQSRPFFENYQIQ